MALPFDDKTEAGNVTSVWAFRLYNSGGGSFKIATSGFDIASIYYHPIIKNKPSIRTSIDLAKSTAKTSDVTVTCVNEYLPSKLLSEELLYGTDNYINQNVEIYQHFSESDTPTGVQIYTGRLVDVSHDHETCTLKIQSARPWDFISIPNIYTTISRVPVPCAYGNFDVGKNSYWLYGFYPDIGAVNFPFVDTGDPEHDYYTSDTETNILWSWTDDNSVDETEEQSTLRPCPFNDAGDGHSFFVSGETAQSNAQAQYYDKSLQQFIPINTSNDNAPTTSVSHDGQFCIKANRNLTRSVKTRPLTASIVHDWTSSADLEDLVVNDYRRWLDPWTGTLDVIYGSGGSQTKTATITLSDLTALDGEVNMVGNEMDVGRCYLVVSGAIKVGGSLSTSSYVELSYSAGGSSGVIKRWNSESAESDPYWQNQMKTPYGIRLKESPSDIVLTLTAYVSGPTGNQQLQIYWCRLWTCHVVTEMRTRDDQTKLIYTGANGYTKGYSGGGGADITNIPEAHRDILNRYGGFDETTPEGFSTLANGSTGIRENWNLRYWLLKPTDMRKILEKLQFEGGFIFTFKADGTMKYISIPASPSVGIFLGDADLSQVRITHTPFSELQTEYRIQYQKHPSEDKYYKTQNEQSGESSVIRDKWNIKTKENIREIELDALIETSSGTDEVQGFADYYFGIFGDIKIMVSGNIVNPVKWIVEVGDIVGFNDLSLNPYGETWGGRAFVITDITRSVDSLKFKAREVG